MPHNEDLKPEERKNLDEQLRITSREAEIRENMVVFPGPPAAGDEALNDTFVKNIMNFEDKWDTQLPTTIGTMLGEHTFLDVNKLTEEEAENAVVDLLNALAKNSVRVHGPEMVSAKEFYRWLSNDFMKEDVLMPGGDGWNVNYTYSEMVPKGPDAMNFMVKTFVDSLFRIEHDFDRWIFEDNLIAREEGDYATQLLPFLHRYITAWRDAIKTVAEFEYVPVAGVLLDEELADFTFNINYTLIRENGSRDAFSGTGSARLVYDGCYWSIRNIRFPGFEMPDMPE